MDRVPGYEPVGRRFESCVARHQRITYGVRFCFARPRIRMVRVKKHSGGLFFRTTAPAAVESQTILRANPAWRAIYGHLRMSVFVLFHKKRSVPADPEIFRKIKVTLDNNLTSQITAKGHL